MCSGVEDLLCDRLRCAGCWHSLQRSLWQAYTAVLLSACWQLYDGCPDTDDHRFPGLSVFFHAPHSADGSASLQSAAVFYHPIAAVNRAKINDLFWAAEKDFSAAKPGEAYDRAHYTI